MNSTPDEPRGDEPPGDEPAVGEPAGDGPAVGPPDGPGVPHVPHQGGIPRIPPMLNNPLPPQPRSHAGSSIGIGVAVGFALQVLAVILMVVTLKWASNVFVALWPFIVVTVAAIVLMFFRSWRRFATGVLIVSAATWLIAIGPCIVLLNGL